MAVLEALRSTPAALGRSPSLFGPALALSVLQGPQLLLPADALVGLAAVVGAVTLGARLVVPFVEAGLVGMSDEALDGSTTFDTFLRDGKDHYVSVLVAYIAVFAVQSAVLGVVAVLGFVGGFLFLGGGGGPFLVASTLVGLLAVLGVVGYLAFAFLVQFYGQAIVLEGAGPVDGLRRSARLVLDNLVAAAGYSMVVLLCNSLLVVSVVGGWLLGVFAPESVPVPDVGGGPAVVAAVLLVRTLLNAFLVVFAVAFFRALTRPAERPA